VTLRVTVEHPHSAAANLVDIVDLPGCPYVNAPEVRLLTGRDPNNPKWIDAYADGLVAILLPGLAAATHR
jgi:hypothetical protein